MNGVYVKARPLVVSPLATFYLLLDCESEQLAIARSAHCLPILPLPERESSVGDKELDVRMCHSSENVI